VELSVAKELQQACKQHASEQNIIEAAKLKLSARLWSEDLARSSWGNPGMPVTPART